MKFFIAIALILNLSFAGVLDKFQLKDQVKINNSTKIRNIESNINDKKEFVEILNSFQSLENKLMGFEEKVIINKLKIEFRKKYIVEDIDLINIYTNLNNHIKVK